MYIYIIYIYIYIYNRDACVYGQAGGGGREGKRRELWA